MYGVVSAADCQHEIYEFFFPGWLKLINREIEIFVARMECRNYLCYFWQYSSPSLIRIIV